MGRSEKQQAVAAAVHAIAEPVLERLGYELVLVEYRNERAGMVLRLYVDREGGINVDECAEVSREVSAILDVEDPIDGQYHLEVSSPGVDRPLSREKDFVRFCGEQAKVVTLEPLDGRRTFRGLIRGVEGGEVILDVDGSSLRIPMRAIARANLIYQF